MMMFLTLPEVHTLRTLTADGRLLLLTRVGRLFAYGWLSVVLALSLAVVGLTEQAIGLLRTLTLVGNADISLWMTTRADRMGRRRMSLLGAGLMVFGVVVCGLTSNLVLLALAALLGYAGLGGVLGLLFIVWHEGGSEYHGRVRKSGTQDYQQVYVVVHGGRSIAISPRGYGRDPRFTDADVTHAVDKL